ncbi:MAG: APC family permease [Phycisphaerae bacterium]|jgi:amino acid transporter
MSGLLQRLKNLVVGAARSPTDRTVFHKISLIAFFAWVGLGADGLSSSCYGPQEAIGVLRDHMFLGPIVGIAIAITVFVICSSYSQIVELFPTGGGGYLVASKLLSPTLGMVSGCALLIDYMLTIAVSIASGADALFSFLPPEWGRYKVLCAAAGILVLMIMNLRGVRESVIPLIPIFLIFVITHVFVILYSFVAHGPAAGQIVASTATDLSKARSELGLAGILVLLLRAYSMGAGTFTGIEAVSNGLPILREPRVHTAKRTMLYMAVSLAFTAGGLMVVYFLHGVTATGQKTANAVLLDTVTGNWGDSGRAFVWITLVSEAAILFVAAQAGFVDGPRVISNMALDRWFPGKFAVLSDRLVTAYGIVVMGMAALVLVLLTQGRVSFLVVLYSINVFITFVLSQSGMVRHWWSVRATVAAWRKKLSINALGLVLCSSILVSMIVVKFHEGGWITLLITSALAVLALSIRRHYKRTFATLKRLDGLVAVAEAEQVSPLPAPPRMTPGGNTAAILVNGFNGLGLHSLLAVIRLFGKSFDNYAFVQIGVIDAGNFKGVHEVQQLREHASTEVQRYVDYMAKHGLYAEGFCATGVDVIEEIGKLALEVSRKFPNVVFFGGQLVFAKESPLNRLLHNYIVFAAQRRLYAEGIPFVILPVRL